MTATAEKLTNSEWELMRIVWTWGDIYSSELIKLIQDKRQWADSTVKTLLRRLVQKQALTVTREGRRFRYSANLSETQAIREAVDGLFDQLCSTKKGVALAELVQQTPLSRTDIERLQALLADKLVTAPAQIKCNCLPGDHSNCDAPDCCQP